MEELIARIENQLRLYTTDTAGPIQEEEISLGSTRFRPARYELVYRNNTIKLSHRETQVLSLLCQNKNQAVDRKKLLQMVWGDDSFFNSRTLDVYIRKLREYLKNDLSVEIITLKGQGYFFRVGN